MNFTNPMLKWHQHRNPKFGINQKAHSQRISCSFGKHRNWANRLQSVGVWICVCVLSPRRRRREDMSKDYRPLSRIFTVHSCFPRHYVSFHFVWMSKQCHKPQPQKCSLSLFWLDFAFWFNSCVFFHAIPFPQCHYVWTFGTRNAFNYETIDISF